MHYAWRLLLLVTLLVPALANAQPAADETDRARARYEAGRSLYQVGRYDDAIREFSAGYDLSQKPRFLYNLALCYRKLGDLPRTRDYLRRYLSTAPENDPNRHSIEGQLADVEAELAIQTNKGAGAPAAATARPADKPATAVASESKPSDATEHASSSTNNNLVATAPPPRPSAKRHLAWAIPVSVVVVGVAVGLGVYFGTRGGCAASVGCIDAGR